MPWHHPLIRGQRVGVMKLRCLGAAAVATVVTLLAIPAKATVYDLSNAITENGNTATGSFDVSSGFLLAWSFTVFDQSNVAISQISFPFFGESQFEQVPGSAYNWVFDFSNPAGDVLQFAVATA